MSLLVETDSKANKLSCLEKSFYDVWSQLYPEIELVTQHRIIPNRQYRFDFAHIDSKVAIEIQGGIWIKSGHTSGRGLRNSYEKLNLAHCRGWVVFQLSSDMINYTWLTIIYLAIVDRQKNKVGCNPSDYPTATNS